MLINNAGVLVYTDFDGVTAEDLLRCFTVNAVGPLLVAQQLHRRGLIGGGGGATLIGNVTSKVSTSSARPAARCRACESGSWDWWVPPGVKMWLGFLGKGRDVFSHSLSCSAQHTR